MEKSRLFESLVVQMIDISLEHKVPTANDIADTLTQKGWDLRQVAGVWSVSSDNSWDDCWSVSAIDRLGGKGTTARVWNELKEAHKTGFPKCPAGSEILEPRKRLRTDQHESKVSNHMRVSTTAPSKMDSLTDTSSPSTSKVACTQQSLSRKILTAGRKGKPMNKGKITWSLSQAKEESPEDQAPLLPSSPELIPPTPDTSKPKQRRRGRKKKLSSNVRDVCQQSPSRSRSPFLAPSTAALTIKKLMKTSDVPANPTPTQPSSPPTILAGEHLYVSRKKSSSISPRKKAPSRALFSTPRAQSPSPTPFPSRPSRKIFEDDRTGSEAKMTGALIQDVASGAAPTDKILTGNGSMDGNLP